MKPTVLGLVLGWLLSCWVQVPSPLQTSLKTVAQWISVKVSNGLTKFETRVKKDIHAKADVLQASVGPE